MSDDADRADQHIAAAVQSALNQLHKASRLHSNGRCHFCDEVVSNALLFCDADCRDDHEKEQAARQRTGR